MGLRERIEAQIRQALRDAQAKGGGRINVATRVNQVVVRNVGGGEAAAHAEQNAPIVQEPSSGDESSE
ncbi:MAG TPA: hypothetical protein VHT30_02700 [Acidimicrobiales bacterium]|jgi:hypothetical protein|nr:hypothetical protein [Acidimicrobiales bacterium]